MQEENSSVHGFPLHFVSPEYNNCEEWSITTFPLAFLPQMCYIHAR